MVDPQAPVYVVGIGASAGGLNALERFFDNLPRGDGMAFVIIQHLSPDFKSLMDELLARHTPLPIQLVEDGMPVEAGRVYLIPPKKEMIISGGRLLLSERDRQQELTLPIDVFFRSLAQDCGARAVAIVLSGGGSDGSRGVRAVHEAGGLVIVQDTESAQFDGMPRTTRDTGVAQWVLAPEEMPRVLVDHVERSLAQLPPPLPPPSSRPPPRGIDAVYQMLEEEFGLDFTHYKPSTVTRRIERRLALARSEDIEEYVQRLRRERSELDSLYRDLLIGVTRFFRDEEAFDLLERQVIPELLARRPRDAVLRLWVAGCATGEEAYSIAIVLQDLMMALGERQVKIFATDVHPGSLERAARALYDEEAVANVSRERLERYFIRTGGMFQVVPDLRQMIVFASHNVIRDAPFTRVDLISCRNLLIYLQTPAQQKALSLFHFALNRGGVLFLGPSESIGTLGHDFENVDKHWRFYRKHSDARIPLDPRLYAPVRYPQPATIAPPAAALGSPLSTRIPLMHALHGDDDAFKVTIRRVRSQSGGAPEIIVSVDPAPGAAGAAADAPPANGSDGAAEPGPAGEIALLQAELQHTKESLQSAIEQLQASNEELQASNEELQASNEELQSTNEELQSVNEELYTVNAEYQRKIGELVELTNDMDHLLASTEIGTIFLDSQLKIRRFTPQIAETFNLVPHDIGRSIETFAHRMDHPELLDDLRRVLAKGEPVERELRDVQGKSFFLRLLPYRVKGAALGVVLTLIDVSGLKAAEDALFHERYLLNSLLSSVRDAIYFKDARGRFIRVNPAMAARLGLADRKDAVGKTALELPDQATALALHKQDEAALRTGEEQHDMLERRVLSDGTEEWDLVTRLPLRDAEGHSVGIVVIFRSVTQQKRAEEKIREAVRRRDQFLAMLSHELRNPLGAIVSATSLMKTDAGALPAKRDRLLGILDRQTLQMTRLLDDLLEASRVTQNKIELRKRVVDLGSVVREALDVVQGLFDERGQRFTMTLDPEPMYVDGDPARLQQIQVNLLSNAAKYTPRGGQVSLVLERDEKEAVIRVRDTGAGIPVDMLDSVFELFVQSSRTLDRAAGGLGLGLTLVRSLVGMHGGTVVAHSEGDGRGSEFIVRLPLARKPVTEAPLSPQLRQRLRLRRGAKVVVVEDNPDSRELLCEFLTNEGFDCKTASTGPAALALIEEVRPDIAILDVGLPGMDGFELARHIRKNPALAGICLIALTGYGRASDKLAARNAGFDEHLVKPVNTDRLLRLLTGARTSDVPLAPPDTAEALAMVSATDRTTPAEILD